MTKELIQKYGINFQNRVDKIGNVNKFPGSNQVIDLTSLLVEWQSVEAINTGLLIDIDNALSDPNSDIDSGSTAILLTIQHDVTYFYPMWGRGKRFNAYNRFETNCY